MALVLWTIPELRGNTYIIRYGIADTKKQVQVIPKLSAWVCPIQRYFDSEADALAYMRNPTP